jgi:hypothetical protein
MIRNVLFTGVSGLFCGLFQIMQRQERGISVEYNAYIGKIAFMFFFGGNPCRFLTLRRYPRRFFIISR